MDPHRRVPQGGGVALSIIIASYDTVDYLEACLESIERFPPRVSFEVLVVDNASPDSSVDMVRRRFPWVQLLPLPENVGFARANNHAIRRARGRSVLLLNSDTRVLPGSLDGLLDALQRHPAAGAVGCRQVDGNMRLQLTWGRFPSFFNEVVRKVLHWRLRIDGSQVREYLQRRYSDSARVDWVSGSCLLVRGDALRDAGMLDENIFLYFEDIDWCRRIQDAGWQILYEPSVRIVHHGGASAARHLIDALVAYRRSQFYFCRKYFGRTALVFLKALVGIKSTLAFARHSFSWLGAVREPDRRFRAHCSLLTLKKILESLFEAVPVVREPAAPPAPLGLEAPVDVREAS